MVQGQRFRPNSSPKPSCVTLRMLLTSLAQYAHLPDGHAAPQKAACELNATDPRRTHAATQTVAGAPLL